MAYVVKKGDNLSTVAKQNGMTLKKLLELNKDIKNPDYIQIGQKINLTNSSPTGKKIYDNNDGYPITPKNISPSWNKVTKGAGNPATVANFNKTPEKKAPIKKQVTQKEEPGFLDFMKNKIYEIYQDAITAIDQQTSKKVVAKPKVKIDDSFIDYGYKELGTYKDQSFKAGKNDSLLSAMNVFDNDKGFDYIVSPKVKEGKKTFNNVKGVAHFLMDSDITPNQKYTTPYIEKGNNIVKSAQAGKFTPYLGTSPDDYVMYYKNTGNDKVNVKYGQLKDKDKYKGYEQIKVRSVPFGELDFNNKKSAGFAKKASYIGTLDGKQTSIITDPESNDVYGRFSGGSGIFYFKEPKTGKTISVDVSGSVNTIKQVGEELSKKYNVDPKQLQFLYHDMGSYSAKPKSHNGVLSNEQWQNYNVNNKGYSGAALMYPMEFGGMAASDNVDMGYYSNPLKYFAARGINISDDDCLECGGKVYANNGANAKKQIPNSEQVKTWNKAKHDLKLQLQKEGKDISYLDHNLDYAKTFLQGYNKQNNFIFGEDKSPEEIVKFWQEYNNDVYSDPTYKSSLLPFEQTYQKSVENNERNDSINPNNRSNPDGVLGSFTINDITPLRVLKKKGTDESGEAVIILNPYSPEKFTIEKNSIIKKNTPVNNEQLLQELYTVPNYGVQPGTSPSFQNGGIVKAWIQKFSNGGRTNPTTPFTDFPTYENYNNNSFLTPDQINQKPFQNTVPLANTNMPQNIGTNYFTPYDASNDQVNKDNQLASSMMKSSSKGLPDPVSMGLDVGGKSLDATANLLGSLGKDNSKAQAFGQGASGAMNVASQVTAPFKDIPIAGKAIDAIGKTLGFFIGGALEARRKGIENEEMDKYNKLQEYTSRNTQTAQQPSYYGQYMSKYGSNIKNLEQRLVDDIFSDYDKFMKLT